VTKTGLSRLDPIDADGNVIAVIETSRDTRTKLTYDEKLGAFKVTKVLPQGMSFPFDFGFIPSTRGDDKDPLDVLVLIDEALPTGTVVPTRLVGVIEAEQTERDGGRRNWWKIPAEAERVTRASYWSSTPACCRKRWTISRSCT